jgi:hypothetical protein
MAPSSRRPTRAPRRVSPETPRGFARRDSGKKRRGRPRSRSRLPVPRDRSRTDSARPGVPNRPRPSFLTFNSRRSLNTPSETRSLRKIKTKTTRRPRRPRRGVAVRHRVGCAAAAVRGLPPPAQEQKLQVRRGDREGGRRRVRRAEVQVRLRDRASRGGADEGEAVGGRGFVSVARLASVDVQTRDERNVATRRVWTASCTCASGSDETTA